jgi:hypothetical protein
VAASEGATDSRGNDHRSDHARSPSPSPAAAVVSAADTSRAWLRGFIWWVLPDDVRVNAWGRFPLVLQGLGNLVDRAGMD